MKEPPPVCKRSHECEQHFPELWRIHLHRDFWLTNPYTHERRNWVRAQVSREKTSAGEVSKKQKFSLPTSDGQRVSVCRDFFLNTLGLTVSFLSRFKESLGDADNSRDEHEENDDANTSQVFFQKPPKKATVQLNSVPIENHILSFDPHPSHYRLLYTPNRRYIDTKLTIRDLWRDFCLKNPDHACSETSYRKVLKEMNVGVGPESKEACALCHTLKGEEKEEHVKLAENARKTYRDDAKLPSSISVLAADLQKVYCLPKIGDFKEVFFASHITAYNETFSRVNVPPKISRKRKRDGSPVLEQVSATEKKPDTYCTIWDEKTSGRKSADIVSTFVRVIEVERREHIILWADNCVSQNKNYTLFNSIGTLFARNDWLQTVEIKYLQKGHTYNAADKVHAAIAVTDGRIANVYDTDDFENLVRSSCDSMEIIRMRSDDFFEWPKPPEPSKKNKLPLLKTLVHVKFTRDDPTLMLFKTTHSQEEFSSVYYTTRAHKLNPTPPTKPPPDPELFKDKAKPFFDLLPSHKQDFWK